MKRNLTLLILLFVSFSNPSLSETKDDLVERNNLIYKKFSDVPFSGVLEGQWDGEFKDGKKVGLWRIYYVNGQLREKGSYIDGIKDGYWEKFLDDGKNIYKGFWKNGKREGLWEFYFEGQLELKGSFVDGKPTGIWEDYYKGYLFEKGTPHSLLIDNYGPYLIKDGYWVRFYENGNVFEEKNYKEGKLDGEYKLYNEDGSFRERSFFKDGEEVDE